MTPIGPSPEEDQLLAGLIMWVPGGLYHVAAALWFLMRSLRENMDGDALRADVAPAAHAGGG